MSSFCNTSNADQAPKSGTAVRSEEWDKLHQTLHTTGDEIRRQVVGQEYVERSLTNASEFSMPMQQLATEYAWGGIWSRPGLARRDRSILNIGMLAALGKFTELATHVRGALNNGVTEIEVQECLLQVASYCGMPAGMESFRAADMAVQEWKSNNAAKVQHNQS
ncbi:related to Carboxymuconolactone decarboxylase [Melanopsichium pennsylvanicum]|uniref:Related to Carboxymuconolactone decarboxylase n=2 Tax=Melanopsichium pennsylvanicum TaxID=63383 RepID=A0AAJ4XR13_9BASI|nr:related to Carboxymuconolactone decarboxylase [Melanopsichium pennsylvanicum]